MPHFITHRYHEVSKQLTTQLIPGDSRTHMCICNLETHEFAPSTVECTCGKYKFIDGEVKEN